MTYQRAWSVAFARQASADLLAFFSYERHPEALVVECHKQLFLQMACEKLCKAHLLRSGTSIETLQTSHGYVKKNLPVIIREEWRFFRPDMRHLAAVIPFVQQLAGEIELLAPAVRRGGNRPDNCEYPWARDERVISPLDWTFAPSRLIVSPSGRTVLKLIQQAIQRLL
jgi:hypothetical protein